MLPIHIICHAGCEPPGYLCTYFDKRQITYKKIQANDNIRKDIRFDEISGFVLMGGPHSANDDHHWIAEEIKLIQQAVEQGIPLMGVCFGAQLISKALGGDVFKAARMENGWHQIEVDTAVLEKERLGKLPVSFEAFQWHEDVFTNPVGAIPVFTGEHNDNQGFVYGKALAMQFHLEMTEHMVHDWLSHYEDCLPEPTGSVQTAEQITDRLLQRLDRLHHTADLIYDWWLSMAKIKA